MNRHTKEHYFKDRKMDYTINFVLPLALSGLVGLYFWDFGLFLAVGTPIWLVMMCRPFPWRERTESVQEARQRRLEELC